MDIDAPEVFPERLDGFDFAVFAACSFERSGAVEGEAAVLRSGIGEDDLQEFRRGSDVLNLGGSQGEVEIRTHKHGAGGIQRCEAQESRGFVGERSSCEGVLRAGDDFVLPEVEDRALDAWRQTASLKIERDRFRILRGIVEIPNREIAEGPRGGKAEDSILRRAGEYYLRLCRLAALRQFRGLEFLQFREGSEIDHARF